MAVGKSKTTLSTKPRLCKRRSSLHTHSSSSESGVHANYMYPRRISIDLATMDSGAAGSAYRYETNNGEGNPALHNGAGSNEQGGVQPPAARRGSMSDAEQAERRASIKNIMTDTSLTPLEKRRSIQHLMDGRRTSLDHGQSNPYLEHIARLEQEGGDSDNYPDGNPERGPDGSPDDGSGGIQPMETDNAPLSSEAMMKKHPYSATTTAVPAVAAEAASSTKSVRRASIELSRRAVEAAPQCQHYERNCHIVAPCCGATFGCRICHDDCPVLPPLLATPPVCERAAGAGGGRRKYQRVLRTSSMPTSFQPNATPEHHTVDRFAIREVVCRTCFTKQSSKTNFCVGCHTQFGEYHCAICNLWMSNEERPYHCPDCGFCRVGGGENFRHCQDCGMCIDKQLFKDHNCKVGKYMSNCPVCQEDLFSSRDASHELPCGHAIHWHCFRELASHDSRCPMCKKTAETHERMKPTWDAMAMGIALQPVPPELAKAVTIKCNDCEKVQQNRSWHFLGVQCRHCESFNTVVERITMMGTEAHEFLLQTDPPANATRHRRRASISTTSYPYLQR